MHYLVTGGCGFIGSHLSERLVSHGHTVTILDDLSTGKRGNVPASIPVVAGDITTPGIFDALIEKADGCFHLAAIASVPLSREKWLHTHQVNLGGTVALFDAIARSKKHIPVVYASSAAVYGNATELPLTESIRCTPTSGYGADKLGCEHQGRTAAEIHHIPNIGLRFFNVYGERQDPESPYSGVISIFGRRMKKNNPVTIYGDGLQARDFIYVGDVVDGMLRSMQALEHREIVYNVFNLCTGSQCSINMLAQTILEITGSTSSITHVPERSGDIRVSIGNPSAAKTVLGFEAIVPLTEGLKVTLRTL